MNPKALIPLIVGLAIAGFAAKLGFDQLQKARAAGTQTVTLWAVTQDVPRGSPVLDQNLRPIDFPAKLVPPGALLKKEQIIGRVPHTGVPANVPVLSSMLLPKGTEPGVYVPEGYRAVAVKIDESSGVDNHLQPSCYVDVIGLFSVRKDGRSETIAKTILKKVQVAAVGQRLAPVAPETGDANSKSKKSSRAAKPARAVTLLVKPEQVPTLHLAEQRGKIKLAMRGSADSPKDMVASDSEVVTEDDLLGLTKPEPTEDTGTGKLANWFGSLLAKANQPKPMPRPQPPVVVTPPKPEYVWTMTVYNGDERQVLGWSKGNLQEPVILSGGGPNIFDGGNTEPPPTPGRVGRPDLPIKPGTPHTDPNKPTTTKSEHGPKELFE